MFVKLFLCYSKIRGDTMRTLTIKKFYWGKKLINWSMYLIFIIYILYLLITSSKLITKILFGMIGFIIIITCILFEFLKTRYDRMIASLTVSCDIKQATKLKEELQKIDLFHGFKQSIIIFESLLFLDSGNYQICLSHLEKHKKFFHSTLDYLFIYYHTQMYCYYFLENKEQLNNTLMKLLPLKSIDNKKLTPLYSWHEIHGMKYFYQKRFSTCLKELEKIDLSLANNRELTYYLYLKAQCFFQLNQQQNGNRMLKEVKRSGNTLSIAKNI